MPVDKLSQRNGHFLLNGAGVVDMAGDAEKFGPSVVGPTEGGEPTGASSHDGGADSDCFDVGDGGGAVENS